MKKIAVLLLLFVFLSAVGIAQTADSKDHRTYLRQVSKLLNERKTDEALKLVTEAISKFPNETALYFRRAEINRNLKKYDLVEDDLNMAVSVAKEKYNAYLYAASLFLQIKQCDKAFAIITKAVNLAPTKTNAYYTRATLQRYCFDKKAEALNDLDYILSIDPQNTYAKSFKNKLLAEMSSTEPNAETNAELIRSLKQQFQNSPDEGNIRRELSMLYVERARFYEDDKKIEEMFADLDRAVEIHPTGSLFKIRGKKLAKYKYYEEAIEDFKKALEEQPGFWVVYLYMGDIYEKQNQFEKAIDTYKKALTIDLASEKLINDKIKRTQLKMQEQSDN